MSKRLLKSTLVVGSVTLLSRVLGFVRDVVVANLFGASAAADAFFVAFKIPNFLRRLFAEGAFSQAFVPVLAEYKSAREPGAVRDLVNHVSGVFAGVLAAFTAIGILAAPLFILVFAPGFLEQQNQFDLATHMLRITFPYLLLISLAAFVAGILNSYGQFGVPAFTPVLLNLSMISAALYLSPHMVEPITALAWGVLLGGILQFALQLPFLWRLDLLPRPRWAPSHPGVRQIVTLMGPTLFAVSVSQINLLIDTLIASFLVHGSISWLYYSDRLVEFPLGVFGIALATVILPSLSERHASGDAQAFSATLDWALRLVLIVATPAAVALAVLAAPMIATLFQYGEFSGLDVIKSSYSLMAYAAGLIGFTVIKVAAPAFFARQDTKTPVKIGVLAMLTNIVLNVVLVFPLAHAGLALATSLAALLNGALLVRGLRRAGVHLLQPGWPQLSIRVLLACAAMGLVLFWFSPPIDSWIAWSAGQRAFNLLGLIVAGAGTYGLVGLLVGLRPQDVLGRRPSL
jgi:putative peptidoglycan lipid II flippase